MHVDVPADREHVRGCGGGLMVIIWARNLSWDLVGVLQWYEGQDFVGDSISKIPALRGIRLILAGDLSS